MVLKAFFKKKKIWSETSPETPTLCDQAAPCILLRMLWTGPFRLTMCTSDWVSLTFFPLAPKAAHHTWFYLLLFHFAMDPSIFPQEDMKTVLSLLLLLHNIVLHGYCFNKSLFGYISFWIDTNFPNCSLGSGWWRKWVEIYCHLLRRFLEKKVQLVTFGGFYLNNLHNHYASVHNNNFSLKLFQDICSVFYTFRDRLPSCFRGESSGC